MNKKNPDTQERTSNGKYSGEVLNTRPKIERENEGVYTGEFLHADSSYNAAKRIEKSLTYVVQRKR